jgi:UDP-glucose:(heptosyl)LPS alpha-1,3-glucosyltransferase
LKIAYVVHDYHRAGGHSRYVAELASRFSRDHDVHVFANTIERNGASNIHFHHVPAWRANALTTVLSFIMPATLRIGRDFDIVHSQGFCGLRGNIFTSHICNRAWHRALQNSKGGATLRELIFNAVGTTLEYGLYRFARHSMVIAISQRVAQDIVQYYRCSSSIRVIHHGVDLELFSPANQQRWRPEERARYGLSDQETAFLYVGDLRKGARCCIEALSQIEDGRLIFVSRSRTAAYERMAEEAGVAHRIVFAGPTSHVEKAYAAADALLLPSPYDAFGMVVSEAMACGLPVVVSREAGASELIEHDVNGLLLNNVHNALELANHMRSLQADRGWASGLGCSARKTVESMSWDAVAEKTMQVYQEYLRNAN